MYIAFFLKDKFIIIKILSLYKWKKEKDLYHYHPPHIKRFNHYEKTPATLKDSRFNKIFRRETDTKFKQSENVIFAFKKDSLDLTLKRFFIDGTQTIKSLFEILNLSKKSIYYIYVKDGKLTYKEYINIEKKPVDHRVKRDVFGRKADTIIDIYGNINDRLGVSDIEYILSDDLFDDEDSYVDDIDLVDFLFVDEHLNFYYINYKKFKDNLFKLFYKIYKTNLKLEVDKSHTLSSKEDVTSFLRINRYLQYPQIITNSIFYVSKRRKYGGRISNKIKTIKIIKSYK